MVIKLKGQVCHVCGDKAKFYHRKNKKWWCGIDFYNLEGICKNAKQKTNY